MINLNTDIDFSSTTAGTKPVVLLSVQNKKDQRLIKQFLPDDLNVEISANGISGHPFDLCILDHNSFEKNSHLLKDLKGQTAPIFLPFLLLSQNKQSVRKNSSALEIADDVVYIPATTQVLTSRINLLLKHREYSLKLEEKNQELQKKNSELAEAKRKYRLITENSTDMISRHDPDGNYLYVSPASKELTGYHPEELVGQNAFENMHPDDREVLLDEETPWEESSVRWTFRKNTKDGNYKWVESTMKPIYDDQTGKAVEIQASTRDISARKKYERELKEEKEFIDTTVESLPGIFFMLDEDLNFIKWNDNLNKILGYNDDEIKQMQPSDFFETGEHERVRSKIQKILTEGVSDIEISIKSKNGNLIPHYLIARKLGRKNEKYIVGTGINITERIGIERKLRESEKRWASLVKNDPDLIQILNSKGEIKFINQAGARILGFDNSDVVVGKNYFDFIELDNEEVKLAKERMQRVLEGNEIESHTFRIKDSNGELLFLESKAVPITLSDGSIGLQQVAQDVTDRVEYERRLRESLEEKKTLLQEIHHRVKNNMAVVSGMMEMQMIKTVNPEVKNLLSHSKSRIKTMALIHEKLYQSKSLSKIAFGAYVKDLIEDIQKVSNKKDTVNLEVEYDGFSLNVNQAVPCALIINEMVSNAFEHGFTDRDNGIIQVVLKEKDDIIFIRIRDNGVGLPSDFDKRKKKSIGITIIETLIRQLEANHKVESEDGLSHTFSFKKQEIKGSSSTLV